MPRNGQLCHEANGSGRNQDMPPPKEKQQKLGLVDSMTSVSETYGTTQAILS